MALDVSEWLRGLGLERYDAAFRDNDIDGSVLLRLTAEDLREIGVASVGHRRRLIEALAALEMPSAVPPPDRADAALAVATSPERRQLTVMFADLVGSTPLAARLDPRQGSPAGWDNRITPGRRDILWLAAGMALGWKTARAEDRIKRIGFVEGDSPGTGSGLFAAFRDGLHALGWVDGGNIAIVQRWAEGSDARLPDLVDEVIWSGIDVLVTGAAPAVIAAGKVTRTIPVVLVGEPDPVAFGLAESLSHPGGNVTGLSSLSLDMVDRQFDMLQQIVPNLRRLAALAISQQPSAEQRWRFVQTCAERRKLALTELEAATEEALERTFVVLRHNRTDALWVDYDGSALLDPARVVMLATAAHLPAIYPSRRFAAAGGLISYGPDFADLFRRAAPYVDLILKGARPGGLPFGTPVKFDLTVNPKAAKALELSIPRRILASADAILEADVAPAPLPAATPADEKAWESFNKTGD